MKEEAINACRVLMGKYLGKRPFARPKRKRGDNVKTILIKVGCMDVKIDETSFEPCPKVDFDYQWRFYVLFCSLLKFAFSAMWVIWRRRM
jgi:hypothetical protein